MSKVIVCGLGYVGLVVAIQAAEAGHDVIGVDLDTKKIASLTASSSYIEDVSDERLFAAIDNGKFRPFDGPSTELAEFDVAVIAVPTPLRDKIPDLSYVESAGRMLADYLLPGATVILESTTYPGTTEGLLADAIFDVSGFRPGKEYHLGFSPERIDPGNKIHTFVTTPKLVSGTDAAALTKVKAFYDTMVDKTVPVSSPRVAEITKLYENIFAHVGIALVNEMARLCHELGIDVWEMIAAAQTKGHSMHAWYPGPGVGGHCLPIDPMYLSWLSKTKLNMSFRFADLADDINSHMPDYVVSRLISILNDRGSALNGSSILLVGVTYKPDSNDLRESPALEIIRLLEARGVQVTITDPYVTGWEKTPCLDVEDMPSIGRFTAVVVVTNHSDYDYGKIAQFGQVVFDTRHCMEPAPNVVTL